MPAILKKRFDLICREIPGEFWHAQNGILESATCGAGVHGGFVDEGVRALFPIALLTWIPTRSWSSSRARHPASNSLTAPAFPPHVGSTLHSRVLTPHKAYPTLGAGAIRARQLGRSSSGFWLHCSVSPICTTSWITCARSWLIRSSTAASISTHVADLLLFPPLGHPQHVSQACAHEARIWELRSRLFFLAFMLFPLSWSFFLYSTTSLLCAKK